MFCNFINAVKILFVNFRATVISSNNRILKLHSNYSYKTTMMTCIYLCTSAKLYILTSSACIGYSYNAELIQVYFHKGYYILFTENGLSGKTKVNNVLKTHWRSKNVRPLPPIRKNTVFSDFIYY